jgi:hypothetical protein
MNRSKKAQIDIQFNWIFILLVGAIILAFFVGVSVWYKGVQEQKISAEIVTKLDSLFTTAKESPKTARYTEIPAVQLSFSCSPDDCSSYGCPSYFAGGGVSMATETDILFTRSELETTNIVTWSLEWALPYKIANFLYLTHTGVRYVLVYDNDHSETYNAAASLLAENSYITRESINIDQEDFSLTDKNDAFVRIVAFLDEGELSENVIAGFLGDYENGEWDILYVEGSSDVGILHYEEESVPYYGLPLLIGGIFSQDAAFYSCNFYKAGIQANVVSAVYYQRALALEEYYYNEFPEKDYCAYYFGIDAQDAISGLQKGLLSEEANEDLMSHMGVLQDNNAYAVIKGCPRLY